MSQEVKERIFQPFNTYEGEKGRNKHGVGLGLSITKTLVAYLGPSNIPISVDSIKGKGSTFTFVIFINIP